MTSPVLTIKFLPLGPGCGGAASGCVTVRAVVTFHRHCGVRAPEGPPSHGRPGVCLAGAGGVPGVGVVDG